MKVPSRYALACVAAVAAVVAAGCGGDESESADSAFGTCEVYGKKGSVSVEPVADDVLTVQTNLPSPGWWKGTSPESIDGGYEYCLAANIAHRAGLSEVRVSNQSFEALVAGQTKDYDLAMAQISVTPERAKAVEFSKPYFDSNVGVLAAEGSDISEENITSKNLAVQVGTTAVEFASADLQPESKASVFQDTDAMVTAVASGQVDAALQDTAIMLGFAKNSNGALEVVGQFKTGEKYAAIYPQGSSNADALNKAIDAMHSDGTFDKLSAKWLGPELGGDPNEVPMFSIR